MKKYLLFVLAVGLLAIMGGVIAQTETLPPLTDPGPYGVRLIKLPLVDALRDDWELETLIWYPADKEQGQPSMMAPLLRDGPPDRSAAPYPLVVFSHGWTESSGMFPQTMVNLASQGYVVAAPGHHDTNPQLHEYVDRPLDIQLVLDSLAAITEGDLAGMIDMDRVGLMGFSQGAETTLQMLGLHTDTIHYEAWCAEHPELTTFDCGWVPVSETNSYRAALGLENTPEGRWLPFGDDRIQAALLMAPCTFPLSTEAMLAEVQTPVLILYATRATGCDYAGNAVRTYENLGSEDRYLISLDSGQLVFWGSERIQTHFAVAFFGVYLKDDEALQPYLAPDHLPDWPRPHMTWGSVADE